MLGAGTADVSEPALCSCCRGKKYLYFTTEKSHAHPAQSAVSRPAMKLRAGFHHCMQCLFLFVLIIYIDFVSFQQMFEAIYFVPFFLFTALC